MDSDSQTPNQLHHHLQNYSSAASVAPPTSQFQQMNGSQISGFSFGSNVDAQNLSSGFQLNSSVAANAAQNLNSSSNLDGFQLNSGNNNSLFQLNSSGAQNLNQSSNLDGFQLNSCVVSAAQNLNSSANVSGFQLNSCVAQNLNLGTNVSKFQMNSSVAAVQNSSPSSNLAGFQLNSSAVQNSNSSSNLAGFQLNSSSVGNSAVQNLNSSNNVSGFQLNSSGVGNAASGGAQNLNSSSNLSGFGLNSSAVGNAASPGAQNTNSSKNVSGAGGEISNGAGDMGKALGVSVEPAKKKRGRPRKVVPEGGNVTPNGGDLSGGDPSVKRSRGRPAGSGKKNLDASGGLKKNLDASGANGGVVANVGGVANGGGGPLTAETIFVQAGEDISYKIMSSAQQGPETVCILSASGTISNATVRQAATSGGNVTYEGRYEIVSLCGSFHPLKNGSRAGSMSVSLLGTDGVLVGGSVAGMLVAATPIQVVVGKFVADTKTQKGKLPSAVPFSNILNFSAPASGVANSPSQGASSESTEENHDSPLDHGQGTHLNASQPMQQNMSMYSPMTWTNPIKMPPN